MTKKCLSCSIEFAAHGEKKYCSRKCKQKACQQRANQREKEWMKA